MPYEQRKRGIYAVAEDQAHRNCRPRRALFSLRIILGRYFYYIVLVNARLKLQPRTESISEDFTCSLTEQSCSTH